MGAKQVNNPERKQQEAMTKKAKNNEKGPAEHPPNTKATHARYKKAQQSKKTGWSPYTG